MTKLSFCLALACGFWPVSKSGLQAQTYTFTTIAGAPGQSGSADGTNADARFYFPGLMTIDAAGNLYLSDVSNNTIRKVAPAGTNWVVTTIAGSAGMIGSSDGTNSDALFNRPNGVAVDKAGNLFVADHANHTIRKLTPSGTNWVVTTIAGEAGAWGFSDDGTNNEARFWSPTGIAVDAADHLYVVDTLNFTIRGIEPIGPDWVTTTLAGVPLSYGFVDGVNRFARFNYPNGAVQDTNGHSFVADWGNNAIREVKPFGTEWIVETVSGFSGNMGSGDGAANVATFNNPSGVAVDKAGNIYVTEYGNSTIRKISPGKNGWEVSTIGGVALKRGSTDGTGSQALFSKPWGIAVDDAGILYVADYANHTIRKGTLSAAVAPTLALAIVGEHIVLSWPTWASNYVLETSDTLAAGTGWTPLTSGVGIVRTSFVLTNELNAAAAFYRLHAQQETPTLATPHFLGVGSGRVSPAGADEL